MTKPKRPEISVAMVALPDSPLAIIGRCHLAMRRAILPTEELDAFSQDATAGAYDSLIRTVREWFEIEGGDP